MTKRFNVLMTIEAKSLATVIEALAGTVKDYHITEIGTELVPAAAPAPALSRVIYRETRSWKDADAAKRSVFYTIVKKLAPNVGETFTIADMRIMVQRELPSLKVESVESFLSRATKWGVLARLGRVNYKRLQ